MPYTYSRCANLASASIGPNVVNLYETFVYDSNLKTVNFVENPNRTNMVMNNTFMNCTSLEHIILPSGISSMQGSFQNCTNLKCIEFTNLTSLPHTYYTTF
jgi:hypothetical protein